MMYVSGELHAMLISCQKARAIKVLFPDTSKSFSVLAWKTEIFLNNQFSEKNGNLSQY